MKDTLRTSFITMLQKLAWVFCAVFIIIGILGFTPATSGGTLFGTIATDTVNNVVYLVAGVLAAGAAWSSAGRARLYFKVFGIIFAVMTIAGFLEGDSILGFMVTNTSANILYLIAAAAALWAGFGSGHPAPAPQGGAAM